MTRTPKRSRHVALTTLLAASTTLAGCGSDAADWSEDDGPVSEVIPYASVAECKADGTVPATECESAYRQAVADDWTQAPRFDSQQLCEQQFGDGQCEQRTYGGNSFFSPFLTGFLIGSILDGGRYRSHYRPYYRDRRSGTYYSSGVWLAPGYGNRYQLPSRSLTQPVSTPRVQTRSSVVSRGGFGGRVSASSGSRGFGGGWGG